MDVIAIKAGGGMRSMRRVEPAVARPVTDAPPLAATIRSTAFARAAALPMDRAVVADPLGDSDVPVVPRPSGRTRGPAQREIDPRAREDRRGLDCGTRAAGGIDGDAVAADPREPDPAALRNGGGRSHGRREPRRQGGPAMDRPPPTRGGGPSAPLASRHAACGVRIPHPTEGASRPCRTN